ncbi:unnamed protein product [Arabidopsis lyrata]|nr:unnamed protein product [Arabidopsis lyrata]
MISKSSDKTELQRMASLLTSDSDYFTTIVANKYGSKRVQKLLGKSDDVDALFCAAILRGMRAHAFFLLRKSHGNNIANILDSFKLCC